ncbi:MAG: hypothetical protein ABWX84_04605 [Nocardioides sp.]
MTTETRQVPRRTRWAIPATAAVLGVAYLVAGVVGGSPGFGVFGLLLMLGVAAVFVLAARRSETVAGLLDRRDERINAIDRDASLIAGMVVLLAVLVMAVVEIAQGRDALPYAALGALGGVAYLVALVALRFRR